MCNNYSDKYRSKIVDLFITELNDEIISREIEKSIYNYTINLAKKKLIKKKWTNTIFKNLYLTKVKSIYSNINGSLNNQVRFTYNVLVAGDGHPRRCS